jgi:hypothetical protein
MIWGVDWGSALLWGFFSTLVLTVIMSAAQGMGLSRISIPFLVGSIFTPDRDRATVIGSALHFVNGWLVSLVYALVFARLGRSDWWIGGLLGLLQGLVVVAVLLPVLPSVHPRMATEDYGPTPTRQLEPPGFLGLNYGRRTPVITLFAHVCFGALLGALYRLG